MHSHFGTWVGRLVVFSHQGARSSTEKTVSLQAHSCPSEHRMRETIPRTIGVSHCKTCFVYKGTRNSVCGDLSIDPICHSLFKTHTIPQRSSRSVLYIFCSVAAFGFVFPLHAACESDPPPSTRHKARDQDLQSEKASSVHFSRTFPQCEIRSHNFLFLICSFIDTNF